MAKTKPQLVELAVPGFLRFRAKGVHRLNVYQSDDLLMCLLCPCGRANHPALKRYFTAYRSLEDLQEKLQKPLSEYGADKRCEGCGEKIEMPKGRKAFYFYFSPFVGLDFVVEVYYSKETAWYQYHSVVEKTEMRPLEVVSSFLLENLFHPALYHFRIGYASKNLRHDLATAREHLDQAIAANERFWQAYLELARLAVEEKKFDLAADTLRRAERWCEDGNILCKLARVEVLLGQKQLAPALTICDEIVSHDPENAEGYYHKGLVLDQMGDYRASKDAMRQAVTLDPNHLRAANALRKMGFMSLLPGPLRRLWKDSE